MISNLVSQKQQLFDRWASTYDWIFPSVFYQAIHKRLLKYVNLPEKSNVLDLGCGTGRLLDRLANHFPDLRGTGLDFSPEMLRQARQRNRHHPRLIYVQGNAEALPFADSQFDAVFNTLSFLHYPKPEQVFSEVSRVLHPGGRFYLVDPTFKRQVESEYVDVLTGGIRIYSSEGRDRLGRQVGLSCLNHHYLLGPVLLTIFTKATQV
jgi:ubiquinone/menaquinone biosynthesis C-methylase UbiE